ncbi:Tectonic-2, variant 3 [Chamberlinius hualienensis]
MQQLIMRRMTSVDEPLVELGIIRCCLVEMENADNYEIIDATFIAKLTPNLLHDRPKSRSEVAEEKSNQRWHSKWPLLSVVYDNSPYLGHIYPQTTLPDLNSYRSSSPSQFTSSNYQFYSYGKPITTVKYAQLTLPSPILNRKCVKSSIQFLINKSTSCNYKITTSSCSSFNSNLNMENYLINKFGLSSDGYGDNIVSNVTVNVECDKSDCSNNQLKINVDRNLCENVVTYVKYVFQWNGHVVTSVNADITLNDVKINNYISVSYVTEFIHANNNSENDDVNKTLLLTRRSGNPGYVVGENLLTVQSEVNQSQFSHVHSLKLPQSDGDGYCKNSSGEEIKFGMDVITGCKLKIRNCNNFKNEMKNWVCETLLHSDYVSRTGNPQLNNSRHFTAIFRDENFICNHLNYELTNSTCDNLPVSPAMWLTVIVIYTKSGHQGQLHFYTIQGLKIRTNSNFVQCYNTCMASWVDVSMAVEFVELHNTTSHAKKFWLKQQSLPCSQDKCWAELNYPFTLGPDINPSLVTFEQLSQLYQYGIILAISVVIFIWTVNQSHLSIM